jgi:hypothetical protein
MSGAERVLLSAGALALAIVARNGTAIMLGPHAFAIRRITSL